MASKETKRIKQSLGQYKRHSKDKIQDVSDFLKENAQIQSMTQFHHDELKELLNDMKAQVKRYESCLDENSKHLIEEDESLEEDKKNYDTLFDEMQEIINEMRKVKKDANVFVNEKNVIANASTAAAATKILQVVPVFERELSISVTFDWYCCE